MLLVLFLLSSLGFALSVAVHLLTFTAWDPLPDGPYVWLLHVGIFPIFLLLSLRKKSQRGFRSCGRGSGEFEPYVPTWMRRLVRLLFPYVMLNFVLWMVLSSVWFSNGQPTLRNGRYVLMKKSAVIRPSSASEYHRYHALHLHGFSGHWMIFYAIAMTVTASERRAWREPTQLLLRSR